MPSKKIVCLGAGSRYFLHALPDILVMSGLAGSEITLYDIDHDKIDAAAKAANAWAERAGTGMRVRACPDLADAIDGADFAVSSIGGSGVSGKGIYSTSYHLQDILIPAKYGICQIIGDTGGPAGMMMALRSVPIYVSICQEMEKRCPDVVFLQHSNPMAVICRAINKYTSIKIIGICHGVQGGIRRVARVLGVPVEELETVWIGTNHYHWFTEIRHQGKDVYPEVKRLLAEGASPKDDAMTQKLSEIYGYQIVYGNHDSHIVEFYPFMAHQSMEEPLPYGMELRLGDLSYEEARAAAARTPTSEEKAAHRRADLEEYGQDLASVTLPSEPSTSFSGEGLGRLIQAIARGERQVYIVNVPNRGSVPNLPPYAVLELEGVTSSQGVRPIYTGDAPLSLMGLLSRRIAWQEMVADAAVKGSRNLALQALLLDETAIRPELAEAMLDELLAASRPMLPNFTR